MMSAVTSGTELDLERYRRELVVHCYRLLGSFTDAEDQVQETMLRAWRASAEFDPERATLRTWLYRIATNVCLSALRSRSRRPLPTGLGAPSTDPYAPLVPDFEVPWLQPLPGTYTSSPSPEARIDSAVSIRLAFVAALQNLPARQRAVLVLRDVLCFSAAEVAELLETTTTAVNSALRRARAAQDGVADVDLDEPDEAAQRSVLDAYVRAFEAADVEALKRLLVDDAVLEMPPVPLWYRGREDYGTFMTRVFELNGPHWRLERISANGQPALAAYNRDEAGSYRMHTLQIFEIASGGVRRNSVFQDQQVFAAFGLSPVLGTSLGAMP